MQYTTNNRENAESQKHLLSISRAALNVLSETVPSPQQGPSQAAGRAPTAPRRVSGRDHEQLPVAPSNQNDAHTPQRTAAK